MIYVVITLPYFFSGEAQAIAQKFENGLQRLHLRKPGASEQELRSLIEQIPERFHERIVLHDHFGLLQEFQLCGVHLNSRNPVAPQGWKGHVSVSCHSIEELKERKKEGFDYLSLSPVFDSISKKGYNAAFTRQELQQAHSLGIIDKRVLALGGVCRSNIREALEMGFGGVMLLGDAWR